MLVFHFFNLVNVKQENVKGFFISDISSQVRRYLDFHLYDKGTGSVLVSDKMGKEGGGRLFTNYTQNGA